MIPIKLELKNFLPYRMPGILSFEGIHLACLTGSNGAGKSSLLDAITWALWGKARSNHDDDLIHQGQNEMSVQLDFMQEGSVYRVTRQRTRGKKGASALNLYGQDENKRFILISKGGIRETEEQIKDLLKLDYTTFVNSAFLQQGKADAFTTQTPAQRKKILSDILSLDRWSQLEESAKKALERIERDLNYNETRIKEIKIELETRPALLNELTAAQVRYEDACIARDVAQVRLDELKDIPAELQRTQSRKSETVKRLASFEGDLRAVDESIARYTKRVGDHEEIIANRAEIEAGYQSIEAARAVDSTLSDKLDSLRTLEDERKELEKKLSEERATLKQQSVELAKRIAEHRKIMSDRPEAELDNLQAELSRFETQSNERADRSEQDGSHKETRKERELRMETLETEGLDLTERIERLQQDEKPMCPLCGQPLSVERRAELINELTEQRAAMRDEYKSLKNELQQIEQTIKENARIIREIEASLKQQASIAERAGQLRSRITAADTAAEKLADDEASLAKITDQLNNETFAKSIRKDLARLAKRETALGYDKNMHNDARATLKDQAKFEQLKAELNHAEKSLPEEREMREGEMKRRERLSEYIEAARVEINEIDSELLRLQALEKEYRLRFDDVQRLATAVTEANTALIRVQQSLDALDKSEARMADYERQSETLRYQEAIYKELKTAFSKNGVPAMIIETAIPELEMTANELLGRMTDGRMSLRLTTQREKITGGLAETLDIEIADELGTRDYEMYSGGEAFRVNFALRVALSKMLARRAGAHLRTLFIDEGFGTQDQEGRSKLVEAINAIQDDFDLILVITHIDELRDSFPVHIEIEKGAEGSLINIR